LVILGLMGPVALAAAPASDPVEPSQSVEPSLSAQPSASVEPSASASASAEPSEFEPFERCGTVLDFTPPTDEAPGRIVVEINPEQNLSTFRAEHAASSTGAPAGSRPRSRSLCRRRAS
jgi:hypothetical protein